LERLLGKSLHLFDAAQMTLKDRRILKNVDRKAIQVNERAKRVTRHIAERKHIARNASKEFNANSTMG
jgi:hypothetical protein